MVKKISVLLLVLVGLLVVVINFSEKHTNLNCERDRSVDWGEGESTMYLKLTEYRWWVKIWSESDGNLKFEIPPYGEGFYENINVLEENYYISDSKGDVKGEFSSMSKYISLDVTSGVFHGKCKIID